MLSAEKRVTDNVGVTGEAAPEGFARFAAELPFALSAYQREALAALERPGVSVIVVAPTGSGKSVVADAAIWQALELGKGAVYTSPLKALANQRFAQLTARWGARVGLTTGDTVVRAGAPVQVMTAEVYRTIALASEGAVRHGEPEQVVRRLEWVVFDEAHYLSDPQRGTAWEEAMLATHPAVRVLCLSATIGAPERLAGWLRWLGREVEVVQVEERPVPLRHYLAHRGELHLVLDERGQRGQTFPFAGGWALAKRRNPSTSGGPPGKRRRPAPLPGLPQEPPNEWIRREALAALAVLRERDLAPVIAFVSARREAELLAGAAQTAFPEVADGVAVHHAGLPPGERRRVEERLREGLVWLVCGTTTLATGLDVPARSVLVTSFGRFNGREFALFSPVEYRQLAGRAGRLGKDEAGAAVLLASPWHAFEEAFRKLIAPVPPIESAFRPSYATALAWWCAQEQPLWTSPWPSAPGPGPLRPDCPPDRRIHPPSPTGEGHKERNAPDERDEPERRLALALSRTFASYLRKRTAAKGEPPPAPLEPDGQSVLQARTTGKLLELDGLADANRVMTARGRFVLRIGGGAEGRLLLRLLEAGAFDGLEDAQRAELLAVLAEGPSGQPGEDALLGPYHEAHRQQVALERQAGALLTPPVPGTRPGTPDFWRRRQAAADLLERAQRAAAQARMEQLLAGWAPRVLERLENLGTRE